MCFLTCAGGGMCFCVVEFFGCDRAVFLAMASLVWIQPHLLLDGETIICHTYIFFILYDEFIFMGNIVILM